MREREVIVITFSIGRDTMFDFVGDFFGCIFFFLFFSGWVVGKAGNDSMAHDV